MPTRWTDLSPRQQTLLRALCRGLSNDEIADTLGLQLSTVRNGIAEAYRRIGVHNRVQALNWTIHQPESGVYEALMREAA